MLLHPFWSAATTSQLVSPRPGFSHFHPPLLNSCDLLWTRVNSPHFFQLFSTRFNYLRSVHLASTLVNLSELFSLLLNSHQLISSLFSFCHLFSTLFTSTQFVSTMSDLSTSPQLSSTSLNFFHFFWTLLNSWHLFSTLLTSTQLVSPNSDQGTSSHLFHVFVSAFGHIQKFWTAGPSLTFVLTCACSCKNFLHESTSLQLEPILTIGSKPKLLPMNLSTSQPAWETVTRLSMWLRRSLRSFFKETLGTFCKDYFQIL